MAYFDGRVATVDYTEPGSINIYYGGMLMPDGYGHGHVKARICHYGTVAIVYWRRPDSEGGKVVVNNPNSVEPLSLYFTG